MRPPSCATICWTCSARWVVSVMLCAPCSVQLIRITYFGIALSSLPVHLDDGHQHSIVERVVDPGSSRHARYPTAASGSAGFLFAVFGHALVKLIRQGNA